MSLARRAFVAAAKCRAVSTASFTPAFTACFRPSFRSFSVEALSAEREAMLKSNPNQDIPSPDGVERPNAKVTKIVDDIMQLNILESIQLSKALQKAMGLEGISIGMGGGGGAAPAAAAPAAAAAPVAEAKPAEVQTAFAVRLDSFDAKDKIKVIKEVRTATGLGLKESKDLVEGAPKVIKKDLSKADADALVAKMKEAGAKCTLE